MEVAKNAKVKLSELLLAWFVPEVHARVLQKTLQANKVYFTKYKYLVSHGFPCQATTQLKKQEPKRQILKQQQPNEEIFSSMLVSLMKQPLSQL